MDYLFKNDHPKGFGQLKSKVPVLFCRFTNYGHTPIAMKLFVYYTMNNHNWYPVGLLYITLLVCSASSDRSSTDADAIRLAGVRKLAAGRIEEAVNLLQQAVDANRNSHIALYNLATAYLAQNNFRKAKESFAEALVQRPDFNEARLHLAQISTRQGLLAEAREHLEHVGRLEPNNKDYITQIRNVRELQKKYEMMNTLLDQAKYDSAVKLLDELIESCDLAPSLFEHRGDCHLRMNKFESAIEDLKRTVLHRPEKTDTMYRLAQIHFETGSPPDGMKWIRSCLKADPDNKECMIVYKTIKPVLSKISLIERSIEKRDWNTCLKLVDEAKAALKGEQPNKSIRSNLLRFQCECSLHANKEKKTVVSICTEALDSTDSPEPVVLKSRAEAYIKLKQLDKAKQDFQRLKRMGHVNEADEGLERIRRLKQNEGREDYYEILGVPRDANDRQIDKAFRELVKEYHPDRQTNEQDKAEAAEKFKKITKAKDILKDPEKRARYDRGEDIMGQTGGHHPFEEFFKFQNDFNPFGQGGFTFRFNFN